MSFYSSFQNLWTSKANKNKCLFLSSLSDSICICTQVCFTLSFESWMSRGWIHLWTTFTYLLLNSLKLLLLNKSLFYCLHLNVQGRQVKLLFFQDDFYLHKRFHYFTFHLKNTSVYLFQYVWFSQCRKYLHLIAPINTKHFWS
jgi:hypothetical protein